MKKVLFATTALVATAGVASADISLSGSAQMGIQGGTAAAGPDPVVQFVQDIDITFTMSGETDNGLTFGAAIDLDENAGAVNQDDAGTSAFVSGSFGTLTMGDTDGAFDWALTEVSAGGAASINDDHTSHAGWNGNGGLDGAYDGQIVRYDYTFSNFAIAVSVEQDDRGNRRTTPFFGLAGPTTANASGDPALGIGAKADLALGGFDVAVGAGYQRIADYQPQTAGSQEIAVYGGSLSIGTDFGLTVTGNYSQIAGPGSNDGTHIGVGASYTFDAITVHANYGQFNWDAAAAVTDRSGFGASASYDLGGGLSVHAGYGYSDITGTGTSSTYSFGLNMAF